MRKNYRIWIDLLTLISLVSILANACKKDESPSLRTPVITWTNPEDIVYGTLLSATQLNATSDVAGTYAYTPKIGTLLDAGSNQVLKVFFTPANTAVDDTASKTVNINVVYIGDNYRGGKVAYILQAGDPGYVAAEAHGLIAAASDQSTGIQWYNGSYTTTGATATALGSGNDNTVTVVANQGAGNYAAKLCSDLVSGGYSDWFLPSKDELNKLYLNRVAIGGFADENYWSSSEASLNSAWKQNFSSGFQGSLYKNNDYYVRAVRVF
ncbi:MAG: DUF1566 domain-containing protein [Bacteroidales bacterium]